MIMSETELLYENDIETYVTYTLQIHEIWDYT